MKKLHQDLEEQIKKMKEDREVLKTEKSILEEKSNKQAQQI